MHISSYGTIRERDAAGQLLPKRPMTPAELKLLNQYERADKVQFRSFSEQQPPMLKVVGAVADDGSRKLVVLNAPYSGEPCAGHVFVGWLLLESDQAKAGGRQEAVCRD